MTEIELEGWVDAINQLVRIQSSAGNSGATSESNRRIVSKRRRKSR